MRLLFVVGLLAALPARGQPLTLCDAPGDGTVDQLDPRAPGDLVLRLSNDHLAAVRVRRG